MFYQTQFVLTKFNPLSETYMKPSRPDFERAYWPHLVVLNLEPFMEQKRGELRSTSYLIFSFRYKLKLLTWFIGSFCYKVGGNRQRQKLALAINTVSWFGVIHDWCWRSCCLRFGSNHRVKEDDDLCNFVIVVAAVSSRFF